MTVMERIIAAKNFEEVDEMLEEARKGIHLAWTLLNVNKIDGVECLDCEKELLKNKLATVQRLAILFGGSSG